MRDALETLLSPGQPDWSRAGVYCYWDPTSHEILYLGLASDLPTRFAQHNGVVKHGGGNKRKEIDAYFALEDQLGITVLLQGKAIGLMEQIREIDFTMGSTAGEQIAVGEGQLIEMHRLVYGEWPPWNGTSGSSSGKRYAVRAPALLEVLSAKRNSLFAARRTIRVVSSSLKLRLFEATIHAARMRSMMEAHGVRIPEPGEEIAVERIERLMMLGNGHLLEELEPTDAAIRRWLALLGNPDHWRAEAAGWQRAFADMPKKRPPLEKELAVMALLDSVMADAVPPQHILATGEILDTGYLDQDAISPST